ncbi:MAG: hypothetical protein C5B55_00565 [Blastocatellia bacterium]|nr:MAG: hypothetical protein C5B55_00565 [Blastocatellia bacterium]
MRNRLADHALWILRRRVTGRKQRGSQESELALGDWYYIAGILRQWGDEFKEDQRGGPMFRQSKGYLLSIANSIWIATLNTTNCREWYSLLHFEVESIIRD